MNKQSLWLLILQVINLIISLFTTFYVASQLTSDVYAVVSITVVISTLSNSFSFTGIDSYIGRNFIFWKSSGHVRYSILMTTNAILYRYLLCLLLQIPIGAYSFFLSEDKLGIEFFPYLLLYGMLCPFNAVTDTTNIILRSNNKYVLAAVLTTLGTFISKLLTLCVFVVWGFKPYLFILSLSNIVVFILQFKIVRNYYSWHSVMPVGKFIKQIVLHKHLLVSSYVNYLYSYVDGLLVSILLPTNVIGSYGIMRQIYNAGKIAVNNLFDPSLLILVKYKNQLKLCKLYLERVVKFQHRLTLVCSVSFVVWMLFLNKLIAFLNIGHYDYIWLYMLMSYLAVLVYIISKVRQFICLTIDTESVSLMTYFYMSIINVVVSIIVYVFLPYQLTASSILLSNLMVYLFIRFFPRGKVIQKLYSK